MGIRFRDWKVMKRLEPETWTKRSLDQLMLQADRSGDGSLNVGEFMKWMFAEAFQSPSVRFLL